MVALTRVMPGMAGRPRWVSQAGTARAGNCSGSAALDIVAFGVPGRLVGEEQNLCAERVVWDEWVQNRFVTRAGPAHGRSRTMMTPGPLATCSPHRQEARTMHLPLCTPPSCAPQAPCGSVAERRPGRIRAVGC